MTTPGQIVVLNGAPRSGKSSIVDAVQSTFDGLWVNLGVDVARAATPEWCQPGVGLRPGEPDHPAAPHVGLLYAAMYESIAAHSRLGVNVVAEFGHHDAGILGDCARRLAGLAALLVGVRCPLETIIERRNASVPGSYATGSVDDPPPAVLRWQEHVHEPGLYDLELDTSVLGPEECARAIRTRLESDEPFTAFARLADRDGASVGG
jgi:chloramphenicol 3-O phosphotransferase